VVVQIQYFNFNSRGEVMRRSIVGRCSRDNELVLAQWERSVTWRDDVSRRRGGMGRRKGGHDAS
jgi:hypothetical protein